MCPGPRSADALWGQEPKSLCFHYSWLSDTSQTGVEACSSALTLHQASGDSSCGDSRAERAWRLWAEDSPRPSITVSLTLSHSWVKRPRCRWSETQTQTQRSPFACCHGNQRGHRPTQRSGGGWDCTDASGRTSDRKRKGVLTWSAGFTQLAGLW